MEEDTAESATSPSTSRDAAISPGSSERNASGSVHDSVSGSGSGSGSGSTSQSQARNTPASMTSGVSGATAGVSKLKDETPSHSKRRRGLGVVTPNACTECRKKRAKCDGQKPCGRCRSQRDVNCVYEMPVRQSKDNLRTELESLRHHQKSSDHVIAALVRPALWEEVLTRLRGGQTVENISDWLNGNASIITGPLSARPTQPRDEAANTAGSGYTQSSMTRFDHGQNDASSLGAHGSGQQSGSSQQPQQQHSNSLQGVDLGGNSPWHFSSNSQSESTPSNSHPDSMNWTPDMQGPPRSRLDSWTGTMNGSDQRSGSLSGIPSLEHSTVSAETKTPPSTWTNITEDVKLVQHLLALYFCWEYPTFASLSKEHFLRDLHNRRHRYCSPMLVNAILALGCRFSTRPQTRANPNDPYTSGDHFFQESLRLFYLEPDHHNLTTIQALGIMSIREASCGRDSESWYYAGQSIRLAMEMGLHRIHDEGDEDELAVQAATFWGAFALDHAWSLATGSLPQCSAFPHLPPKPIIVYDIEASLWVPYTDDGTSLQRSCEQPSNVRSVYTCFCELSELVHESLYILYSPGSPLNARELMNIYTKYLNWYDKIPEALRLGHNFTPAVLFAHLYYQFAILLLFRPFIKLRVLGSKITPRDVCSQAADAMQGLLRSYSQLYTLRRTPSFVPYFVLTSAIMHLTIGSATVSAHDEQTTQESIKEAIKLDPQIAQAINQGIADLAEMAPCHHFAEQALNILRFLAKKWNIEVDIDQGQHAPGDFDRLVKPTSNAPKLFAPFIQVDDFDCVWGGNRGAKATHSRDEKQHEKHGANKMENPLFWPFPLQGRPVLPHLENLEAAGFALL